jgi:hypothetical protein
VVHGDTHLGNLYIDPDGTPAFFDPFPSRSPWFYEVSYHIVAALDVGDRRDWEKPLLAHYLRALEGQGVKNAPDPTAAWQDHVHALSWGLFVFITNENLFQTSQINESYMLRFADAALDHDLWNLVL